MDTHSETTDLDPRQIFDHPSLPDDLLPPTHPSGAHRLRDINPDWTEHVATSTSQAEAIIDTDTRPAPNDDTVIVVRKELAPMLLELNRVFGKVIEQRDMATSSMLAIQQSLQGCERSLSSLRGELDVEPELDKPPGKHRMPEPTFVK